MRKINKRFAPKICLLASILGPSLAGRVLAATTNGVAAAESALPALAWEDTIRSGGWPMYVLAGLSILMLAMVLYFLAILRLRPIAAPALRRELLEKIRNGDLAEARHACDYRRCPLSSIVLAALNYLRSVGTPDPMLLKEVVQGEGQRQALAIEGQIQHLQDIAVIAPMIGLLGTVLGLLRAFSSLALNIAQAQPVVLAGGISQALVTTAFGLIVGIAAMIFHAYFKRRSGHLISHLELAATEALTALSTGQWKPRHEESL
jgi:biopolymer transport protein ExbB